MGLTEEQRIAHLLRRFGLGASPSDMAHCLPLGVEGTLRWLIDYTPEPERFHPYRFCFREGEDAEPGAYRTRFHWMAHFATTRTPLREKLALFWHDHFAVDAENGGDGLMLLDYMNVMRQNPTGKYADLLEKMAKTPAFMEMLTMQDSTRAHPNENFARELFELYTLGVGHYSEEDIKEAARAFTGWSFTNRYWQTQITHELRLRLGHKSGQKYCSFSFSPDFHDDGEKLILGKKSRYSGEELIRSVVAMPRCAEFICGKLWDYFASCPPSKAVMSALVAEFQKTDGSIRAVLYAIARRPEFFEELCVRRRVKSPVDYVIHIGRCFGSVDILPKLIGENEAFDKPVSKAAWDAVGTFVWSSEQMGQELLMPPSVAGWEWGEGWITSNSMVWRMKFGGFQTWEPKDAERKKWGAAPGGQMLVDYIKQRKPATIDALVGSMLRFFDCSLGAEGCATMVKLFEKEGGMQPIQTGNDEWLWGQLWNGYELLRAAPEFHYC